MTTDTLAIISDEMHSLGLRYSYLTNDDDPIVYPYFVGEYSENEPMNEDGMTETTFTLNGFAVDSNLQLERAKNLIRRHFSDTGKTFITSGVQGAAIFYAGAIPIMTGDPEFKRITIVLKVKEWRV